MLVDNRLYTDVAGEQNLNELRSNMQILSSWHQYFFTVFTSTTLTGNYPYYLFITYQEEYFKAYNRTISVQTPNILKVNSTNSDPSKANLMCHFRSSAITHIGCRTATENDFQVYKQQDKGAPKIETSSCLFCTQVHFARSHLSLPRGYPETICQAIFPSHSLREL